MTQGVAVQNRLREQVAEEVRALLARRRLNGAKLAEAIGRSEMYVSRRLRAETAFDLDDIQRIAAVLNVGVHDLLPPVTRLVTGNPNDSLRQLPHPAAAPRPNVPRPVGRSGRHSALGVSPLGGGRRDSTRPVSGVPASRRRPAPMGPGNRPIPA